MFRLGISVFFLLTIVSVNGSSNSTSNEISTEAYNQDFLDFLDNYKLLRTLFDLPSVKPLTTLLVGLLMSVGELLVGIFFPVSPLPELDKDIWWGSISRDEQDTSIRPYEIQFKPERIKRLIAKLADRENFTKPLDNSAFAYGINTTFLETILEYWRTEYDFEARQARLNQYPQYITNIQGLDIHYYHIKPNTTNKKVIPLLMIHGWPFFNTEYLNVFPYLIADNDEYDFVFEIIAPNMPGFGYSEGTSKIGLAPYQIGIILKNLMTRLGFQKFYMSGGDFGEITGSTINTIYPDDVLGFHTNFPYSLSLKTIVKIIIGSLQPAAVVEPEYQDRLYPFLNKIYYFLRFFGYFHMQGTKPDTLGVALSDSPSALASWLLTPASWAANPNFDLLEEGGILDTYDLDEVLDLFTVWWDSESIATSMRIYAEFSAWFQDPITFQILSTPSTVPYSCIKFLYEVIYMPDKLIQDKYPNIIHSTTVDYGGHVASFENPDVLSADILEAMSKMIEYNNKH